MEEHFVESHLGGYYFSHMDKETIEEYCEECGDFDSVLFTYDDEDKNEPFNSLVKYFKKDLVLTKRDLEYKLYVYGAQEIGIKKAIEEIKTDTVYDVDTNKDIFKVLLENDEISKKDYDKLIRLFNKLLKQEYEFIDNFDYTKINLEEYKQKIKKR